MNESGAGLSSFPGMSFSSIMRRPLMIATMIFLTAFAARVVFYLIYEKYDPGFMTREIGINHWLAIAKNLAAGHGYTDRALLTYFPVSSLQATAARGPVPVLIFSLLVTILPESPAVFFYLCLDPVRTCRGPALPPFTICSGVGKASNRGFDLFLFLSSRNVYFYGVCLGIRRHFHSSFIGFFLLIHSEHRKTEFYRSISGRDLCWRCGADEAHRVGFSSFLFRGGYL